MECPIQISYGISATPKQGDTQNGDQYLIKKQQDSILIATIDGLGHGQYAFESAKRAVDFIDTYPDGAPLDDLIRLCHDELKNTHGVVLMLAQIEKNHRVTWAGVGNIIGMVYKKKSHEYLRNEIFLTQAGIVGSNLPALKISYTTANPGDLLIFATDGIDQDFLTDEFNIKDLPQKISDQIFKKYRNPNDDALVLVCHWDDIDKGV
ncbi:MAG: SpoIIE family protein phosphatase [Gammaproteobacteria bacterium]|nr:SpoIIE family protein phosphatase [Gammaproteobacteria bacterium]